MKKLWEESEKKEKNDNLNRTLQAAGKPSPDLSLKTQSPIAETILQPKVTFSETKSDMKQVPTVRVDPLNRHVSLQENSAIPKKASVVLPKTANLPSQQASAKSVTLPSSTKPSDSSHRQGKYDLRSSQKPVQLRGRTAESEIPESRIEVGADMQLPNVKEIRSKFQQPVNINRV